MILRTMAAMYVIIGFFGSFTIWMIFWFSERGDAIERAEVHDIVHKTGISRGAFIVVGGLFWPVLVVAGLQRLFSGE